MAVLAYPDAKAFGIANRIQFLICYFEREEDNFTPPFIILDNTLLVDIIYNTLFNIFFIRGEPYLNMDVRRRCQLA